MARRLAGGQIAADDDDRAAFCARARPGRSGKHTRSHRLQAAQALVRQRCAREHLSAEELRIGGRRRRLSSVRAQLAVPRVMGDVGSKTTFAFGDLRRLCHVTVTRNEWGKTMRL